jgi:hypothetical protein
MNSQQEILDMVATEAAEACEPEGGERGFTIEHILLSITVVHTNRIMQYDDTCANIVKKKLEEEFKGVVRVNAHALYDHSKIDAHTKGCQCHICSPE